EGTVVSFVSNHPPLRFRVVGDKGEDYELTLLLSGGLYLAVSVTTKSAINDIGTFRNQVTTVCKSIYDAATFLTAQVVAVELHSLTEVETNRFWTFRD